MLIIETAIFTQQVTSLLTDDEYRILQIALTNQPASGDLIKGSGGLRKIRWSVGSAGQRGGVRVIYYWAVRRDQILMLFMYRKSERADLTASQIKVLRQTIKDEWP